MLKSDDYNIAEMSFHNGEEYMKSRVLDILTEMKSVAIGRERILLEELIVKVKGMTR